ncbi:MAG: ATP-binding protein [Dehalococcoidia bacterium]|nr:ATP-binding protein [Dehalococcoidia bacterium]
MDLIRRNVETLVRETLNDTPVTVIQGARQVGKSTLASMIARDMDSESVTMDSDTALTAAEENPYEFVSQFHDRLLVIDEIQKCPELLNAMKLSVDNKRKPGRFLITGSANILHLKGANESLAGRAETIVLQPFSTGEIKGIKEDFVAMLMRSDTLENLRTAMPMSRADYARLVENGGYPDAYTRTEKRRRAYFKNYISRVLDHDADELSGLAHLDRLKTIHAMLAGNTSKIYVRANLSQLVGIPESSLNGYIRLLEDLCLIHSIPAWGKNYFRRAISKPKIIMSDTGLVCALHGISANFIANIENGNDFGPLLETFVIAEIEKQKVWSEYDYSLFHYRDTDKKEVDLVLELADGSVIAIEIKSSSSFSQEDFTGIKLLRDKLGTRFHCGIVLYTGTEAFSLGDRLFTAPISAIWQQ